MHLEDRGPAHSFLSHVVSSVGPFIGQICGVFYILSFLKVHKPPLQPSPKSLPMIGFSVASAPANEAALCTLEEVLRCKPSPAHAAGGVHIHMVAILGFPIPCVQTLDCSGASGSLFLFLLCYIWWEGALIFLPPSLFWAVALWQPRMNWSGLILSTLHLCGSEVLSCSSGKATLCLGPLREKQFPWSVVWWFLLHRESWQWRTALFPTFTLPCSAAFRLLPRAVWLLWVHLHSQGPLPCLRIGD